MSTGWGGLGLNPFYVSAGKGKGWLFLLSPSYFCCAVTPPPPIEKRALSHLLLDWGGKGMSHFSCQGGRHP